MADFSALPFPIGGTYFGTNTPVTTDGTQWEGRIFEVDDLDYSGVGKARAYYSANGLPGGTKKIMVVRNVSGVSLLPRRLVIFGNTTYGKRVNGYAKVTAGECYPVDEFVISTGVPANDLFYITISGPAECYTSAAASSTETEFSQGSLLVALTATASTFSTTAGRVSPQDLTGATALLALQVQNKIGIALSACTSAETNTAKLIFIHNNRF